MTRATYDRTIVITGAAGFIGLHLARHLRRTSPNSRLVLIDNFQRGERDADYRQFWHEHADHLLEFDVDLTCCEAVGEVGNFLQWKIDDIYHLAAVNGTAAFYDRPADVLDTNLRTLQNVLDLIKLARGHIGDQTPPRLLFTSSNEAYAGALEAFDHLPIPTPERVPLVIADPYNPRWSYAASKLVGELMVIHTAKRDGFPAVIVRPHNFYGPRSGTGHVIPQMLRRIQDRVDPFPIAGHNETRSFCYIADAVDAIARAIEVASVEAPTFHIGSTTETRIGALAQMLFMLARWEPASIDYKAAPPGSVARRLPDVTKIEDVLGWSATTSLHDGLARTAEWYWR
jgi:nucleoside-diphosphate-sugar epimerase